MGRQFSAKGGEERSVWSVAHLFCPIPFFLKGRRKGIRDSKIRGRFLVSEFGSRGEGCRGRIGYPRTGPAEERGQRLWNGRNLRWNSGIRSLFSYFNYLVIQPIYIMYLAHRIGRRLRKREFPIGSTTPGGYLIEEGTRVAKAGRCSEVLIPLGPRSL